MAKDTIVQIYTRLKNARPAFRAGDVAEAEQDFFRDGDVHRFFRRAGVVAKGATETQSVEAINRAVAHTASRVGDPEAVVRSVFQRHASGDGACGETPACPRCAAKDLCRHSDRRPTIKDLPASERPRERLIGGGEDRLSDAELLAIILRGGRRHETAIDLARRLLERFKDLRGLAASTIGELCGIAGIGEAKAAQIKAAFAIARRVNAVPLAEKTKLRGCLDLVNHFREQMRDQKKETFWAVLLDQKHKIIRTVRISEGILSQSLVHPREVFSPAIRESAAVVAFVHNHPSGDPEPSPEDLQVTARLKEVGEMVGIKVLDHVIIGGSGYVSFAERKLL